MKKVSVIMSTYKTPSEFLEEAINSILNQTYEHLELIIVCDGDKEEYEKIKEIKDKRLKVLLNNSNKGLPYSLNLAIEKSDGDYIARMDSDDIACEDRIQKQVDFLEKNKNVGVCGTEAILFGAQRGRKSIYLKSNNEIKVQILYRATLIHPTVMVRREVYEKYKYNEQFIYAQDFELWSRVSEEYDIAVIPTIGLKYRMHNKQASSEKKVEQASLSMKTIKNNSKKITGKFEEKVCETLYVLGGRKELTKENCYEISKNIDYIIENNKNYDTNILKKVLYNRFFELVIKNRIINLKFGILKKCFKWYNFAEILEVVKNAK